MNGYVTRDVLLAYVEQIEGVFAAIDELGEDKKAIYGAAHDAGIEKTALGKVVAYRRQRGRNPAKFDEQDALVQQYLGLLGGTVQEMEPHTRIRAREVAEQMSARTEFFARIAQERADGYPRRGEKSVVYFLYAADAGVIKIGVTHDLDRRIGSITRMSPLALELILTIPGDHKVEDQFHKQFSQYRLHGEWFSTTDGSILEFVRSHVARDSKNSDNHDPATGEVIEAPTPLPEAPVNPVAHVENASGAKTSKREPSEPEGSGGMQDRCESIPPIQLEHTTAPEAPASAGEAVDATPSPRPITHEAA